MWLATVERWAFGIQQGNMSYELTFAAVSRPVARHGHPGVVVPVGGVRVRSAGRTGALLGLRFRPMPAALNS